MQHTFQLHDLVYLWGDTESEFLQIISVSHYPEEKEPSYELWSLKGKCQLRTASDNRFYKQHLLPVPVADLKNLYSVTNDLNDFAMPIVEYAADEVDEDGYPEEERESMIAEIIQSRSNEFQIREYEINPDTQTAYVLEEVNDGLDVPHFVHQLQQYNRLVYGSELFK